MTLDERIAAFEKEQDELMAALERRTKLEDKAIRLICECKFDEAMKVLASIDDDVAASDEEKPCDTEPNEDEPCEKCMEVRHSEKDGDVEVICNDFDAEIKRAASEKYAVTISFYGIVIKTYALFESLGDALEFIWNFDAKERRE